jgi:hypothetical protein
MKVLLPFLFIAFTVCSTHTWDATNHAAGGYWNATDASKIYWLNNNYPYYNSSTYRDMVTSIDLSGLTGTVKLYFYNYYCQWGNAVLTMDGGILNIDYCWTSSSDVNFKSIQVPTGKTATIQDGRSYSRDLRINNAATAAEAVLGTIVLRNLSLIPDAAAANFDFTKIVVRERSCVGDTSYPAAGWKVTTVDAYWYGVDSTSTYKVEYDSTYTTTGTTVNCYADSTWVAGTSTWYLIYSDIDLTATPPTVRGCTGGTVTTSYWPFLTISSLGSGSFALPVIAILLISMLI